MSLFTGKPNPGYVATLIFGGVTFPCNFYDYDSSMDWQDAPIFNADGLKDHSKGLSGGMVIGRGIWDTGLNVQTSCPLGTEGTLTLSANGGDLAECDQAKVARWHITASAPGQVQFDVAFIVDGSWTDFTGGTANDPSVG